MYEATTATGTLITVSHNATLQQEAIAAAATGPRWIQIYPNMNMQSTRNTLDRFLAAGAQAIIVTVDQQAVYFERAGRNRWLGAATATVGQGRGGGAPLNTLTGPRRYGVPAPGRLWFSWDFMSEMRDYLQVPFLIKGILTPEDAQIAVARGFDGLIVSNHGGRSLDYAPSTLEVLPEIAEAVGGRIPVLMDGGIRRGSDIFKALALGADAVLAGRALRWGLGAFGPLGARRVIEILQAELRLAMTETGRTTLASIDPTAVRVNFP
jgi:4-hydroxymandelate oxidase